MLKEKKLDGKNILMIIASKNFRDEEYFIPYEIFQREGAKVFTASSVEGEIIGVEGGEARSSMILERVRIRDFDAIVFVGGEGAAEYFNDNNAHKIIQEAVSEHKVVAAICIAPVILAKAGVLAGKKATVWSSIADKSGLKELKEADCFIAEDRVVKDKKIITADGPAVAKEFAEKIVKAIIEEEEIENE